MTEAIEPLTVTIRRACELSGLCRSTIYKNIATGNLHVVKVGKRALIPFKDIKALLESAVVSTSVLGQKSESSRKRYGLQLRTGRPTLLDNKTMKIAAERYMKGETATRLAEVYDVSQPTMSRALVQTLNRKETLLSREERKVKTREDFKKLLWQIELSKLERILRKEKVSQ